MQCADTGLTSASLKKDDKYNNTAILVVLCSHYTETTDTNLEALASTGIPVEIVGRSSEQEQASEVG